MKKSEFVKMVKVHYVELNSDMDRQLSFSDPQYFNQSKSYASGAFIVYLKISADMSADNGWCKLTQWVYNLAHEINHRRYSQEVFNCNRSYEIKPRELGGCKLVMLENGIEMGAGNFNCGHKAPGVFTAYETDQDYLDALEEGKCWIAGCKV